MKNVSVYSADMWGIDTLNLRQGERTKFDGFVDRMYEARSAEYIRIYVVGYSEYIRICESIEFRSFFDLKYTEYAHALQDFI